MSTSSLSIADQGDIMVPINGWRRIGIVVVGIWLTMCVFIGAREFRSGDVPEAQGYFVVWGLPINTKFSNGRITLPDGKSVTVLPADANKPPWDIDWSKYPNLPKSSFVQYKNIAWAIALPILVWVCSELLVATVRWIARGFHTD